MPSTGQLRTVLERSRDLGFLGPGDVERHIDNARAFLDVIDARLAAPHVGRHADEDPMTTPPKLLDLGSGGGVPGLVVAAERPTVAVTLLDANERRTTFLADAVHDLEMSERVDVVRGRAEELARDDSLRTRFAVVMARSFAPPSVTAECAVGFLRGLGSTLIVSEPPDADDDRWPEPGLNELGLRSVGVHRLGSTTVRILEVVRPCDDRFPRRTGRPARHPLF